MNKKKGTILLICAAIFVGSYIARSFVMTAMRMAYARQQAQRQRAKPKPAGVENPAGLPNRVDPPLGNLSGIWEGQGQLKGRGFCDLRVELKQNDPAHYSGFSRFSCTDMAAVMGAKNPNVVPSLIEHMNPDSAILTGAVEKGSIRFKVDKTIGTDSNGCAVTDFTVTPFGAAAVAAEWQEGTCQGGSLLLRREPR